jgi:virulence-associated protein VagC
MNSATLTRPSRVFRNGNSIAVRLPKGWALPGTSLRTRQTRNRIILEKDNKKPKTLGEMMARIRDSGPDPGPFVREQLPFSERDFMKD